MEARHIEKAAEFCNLVGKTDLVEYLGLSSEEVTVKAARTKLKSRRKYMQGMQSNPKYKAEAVFLIKNFKVLNLLLDELPAYLAAVKKAKESEHLPIVEMTIKTVLKGGSLGSEQEDYLLKQAAGLGVSEETFRELLGRLISEAEAEANAKAGATPSTAAPRFDDDYYALIGVGPTASRDDIYNAYRMRHEEARQLQDKGAATRLLIRLDKAWKVLGDTHQRQQYEVSLKRTGPPARDRVAANDRDTAPPARERIEGSPTLNENPDGEPPPTVSQSRKPPPAVGSVGSQNRGTEASPRMDVIGSKSRRIELESPTELTRETILVRNVGNGDMPGRVSVDAPWISASPKTLDPARKEQVVTVTIDPGRLTSGASSAVVSIVADHGERFTVQFAVTRPSSMLGPILLAAGVALAMGGGVAVVASGILQAPTDFTLTVDVNPTAEKVLLNGKEIGSGSHVVVTEPPAGKAKVEIVQGNFKPQTVDVTLGEGPVDLDIVLELAQPMDYRPPAGALQANLDQDYVERIMVPRAKAMDRCVEDIVTEGNVEGLVRIHVSKDGLPLGVEVDGTAADKPEARDCLIRQSAAAVFHRFKEGEKGEYATVRYHYKWKEPSSP